MVPVYNDKIFVKHWATAVSMSADEFARFNEPLLISIKVIGGDHHFSREDLAFRTDIRCHNFLVSGLKKCHVNQLSIGGGSAGSKTVQRMFFLELGFDDVSAPDDFARI